MSISSVLRSLGVRGVCLDVSKEILSMYCMFSLSFECVCVYRVFKWFECVM